MVLTIAAIAGYVIYNKPAEKKITAAADESMKATELYSAFENNEDNANQRFLNKVIQVTGIVNNISPSGTSGMTVLLSTGNEMSSISCEFSDTSGIKNISEGQQIRVKGKCTGLLMDVILVQCSIQD